MSRIAALRRADELFKRIPADNDLRGQSMEAVDFLDDYMRIRFGMQPMDKPRDAIGRQPKGDQPSVAVKPSEQSVFSFTFEDEWISIWVNGYVEAPFPVGGIINRLPATIRREAQNMLLDRAASMDVEAVEAVAERWHLAALEARDHLQNIMAGLPGSTPHFLELNDLLMKLDAMAGTPVARESDQWTAEDANRIGEADLDAAARNMAPGPDYRPPAEVVAELTHESTDPEVPHTRLRDVLDELLNHIHHGRWEIISHVPDQRDYTGDFLKEIERARGEVSVQNPAWKALEEAARKITGG